MPTYYPPGSRKGNRTWVVIGSIAGKQREITTNARNKKGAVAAWDQFVQHQGQRPQPRQGAPKTWSEVADRYVDAVDASKQERGFIKKLKSSSLGALAIADICQDDIAAAANELYPTCKPATKNRNAYTPAASVLHYAYANKWAPYLRVKKLKEAKPQARRPAPGDVQKLLDAADGELRLLLIVLACQGWRITETLGVTWGNVRLAEGTVSIFIRKVSTWKTLMLHPTVVEELAALPESQRVGRLFSWGSRSGVYKELRPLCDRVGVKVTPHMLRHEFASLLDELGYTSRDAVELSTWTTEKSLGRYQTPSAEHQRRALASVNPNLGKNLGKKASA